MRPLASLLALLACALPLAGLSPEKVIIKLATVAPDGTTAVTGLQALAAEVEELTAGQVRFKLFTGAVLGDEPAMLEKLEGGQLHGAAFTGVGLGRILSEVRILELPFFFRGTEEQDHVVRELTPHFEARFAEQGYVLLGWADVGWVYIFSKRPLETVDALRAAKVWTWEGDPLAAACWADLGVKPVPLALTDVRPMLDTGLIDVVYNTPYYTLGLQWHPKLGAVVDMPIMNALGAVLVRKDRFEAIPAEYSARVLELGREHLRRAVLETRREQVEALEALQDEGIERVSLAPEQEAIFRATGARVAEQLVDELYPQALLERVRALVTEQRSSR